MEHVRNSNLREYASQFWYRELYKGNRTFRCSTSGKTNQDAFQAVYWGEDPALWLGNLHPYKLPACRERCVVDVERLERSDLENLVIPGRLLDDKWFTIEARIVPNPRSNRLFDLARTANERDYFSKNYDHTQIKCHRQWRGRGSLDGAITEDTMPLIELKESGEYEIIDGWGRLLPYEALVQRGFCYAPVPVFVARPI